MELFLNVNNNKCVVISMFACQLIIYYSTYTQGELTKIWVCDSPRSVKTSCSTARVSI